MDNQPQYQSRSNSSRGGSFQRGARTGHSDGNRGGRSGGRGGIDSRNTGARGGSHSGRGAPITGDRSERPERKVILDLNKYMNRRMVVKFQGDREITGVLSSFDQLKNMVLNDVVETYVVENKVEGKIVRKSRTLGTVVCRGPLVMVIAPEEDYKEVDNPFLAGMEDV